MHLSIRERRNLGICNIAAAVLLFRPIESSLTECCVATHIPMAEGIAFSQELFLWELSREEQRRQLSRARSIQGTHTDGLFGPSMSVALVAASASLRLSFSIQSLRRQDAEANIRLADGPKGEGRDGPESICHCEGRLPERTFAQRMARRAEGGTPGVNPLRGSLQPLSPPPTKNAPGGALFVGGGERGIRTLDRAFDPILP